jgi:hypothetical protein
MASYNSKSPQSNSKSAGSYSYNPGTPQSPGGSYKFGWAPRSARSDSVVPETPPGVFGSVESDPGTPKRVPGSAGSNSNLTPQSVHEIKSNPTTPINLLSLSNITHVLCEEPSCNDFGKPFKIGADGTGTCICCRAYCIREGHIGFSQCRCMLVSPQSVTGTIISDPTTPIAINMLNPTNLTSMPCEEPTCKAYGENFRISADGTGTCICCRTYCVREGYIGYSQCKCSLFYNY